MEIGVYCKPFIQVAKFFAGKCIIKDKIYYSAFILRVNPNKVRYWKRCFDKWCLYWILNGTTGEIRPIIKI